MKLQSFMNEIDSIAEDRKVDRQIVIDAIKEALIKAFRKHIEVSDAHAEVVFDEERKTIVLYRLFEVVEEVEDDALQVELDEIKNPEEQLIENGFLKIEHNIDDFGRSAAKLAKQVLIQKIREAEKQAVYDEYIDKKDEMIYGEIQSVEERLALVNIGRTIAIMPKAQQMSNELYQEGQRLRVIITDVVKDTKGAQVIVSRADTALVKRLFEKEVPEIFDGVVEIKAIAREAGDRTKMAVYSHNPDIDPIGACIGPRGSRVQVVIEELKGEKIDIFEWSENNIELIKNALAPASVLAVYQNDDQRSLTVIVDDKQLSLAIGKRGKNARLAVRLTKQKIDIKSQSEAEELGIDFMQKMADYQFELDTRLAQQKAKQAAERLAKLEKENAQKAQEEKSVEEAVESTLEVETIEEIATEPVVEASLKPIVEEEVRVEPVTTDVVVEPVKKPKRTIRQRQEYVSKFEALADVSKQTKQETTKKRYKKKSEEEELKRINTAELLQELEYEIKPTYTPEELEELDLDDEDTEWYDNVDYDEFDDYYDQE